MSSFRTIVVGFDGSTDAERAVHWAMALAKQADADLIVVHAVGLLEHSLHRAPLAALEDRIRALSTEAGLDSARVRWSPIDEDPCSVLLRATSLPGSVDLLVVGSRGRGAYAGQLRARWCDRSGGVAYPVAENCCLRRPSSNACIPRSFPPRPMTAPLAKSARWTDLESTGLNAARRRNYGLSALTEGTTATAHFA
jgi:nucleotide-binding universal stress UspA family protein